MTLTYLDKTHECTSAERKPHEIIIYTGKVEDGVELIYHIYGDIDFDAVVLDGGVWTESSDTASTDAVLNTLLGVTV